MRCRRRRTTSQLHFLRYAVSVSRRAALLLVVCACGTRDNKPIAPTAAKDAKLPIGAPLVTPGERMSYRFTVGAMEMATYDMGIGDIAEVGGRRSIVVQSHAKATGFAKVVKNIDEVFTSWIDVETGRPVLWIAEESDSGGKERAEARFHDREGTQVPVDFHFNNEPAKSEPQTVSMDEVWDYNALLVALRSWEAPAGSRAKTETFRGRYMWNVTMTVGPRETLVTELGELPALRFDGHGYRLRRDGSRMPDSPERDFSIWISDDDGRVPIKTTGETDFGEMTIEIVDYQPGNGNRLRP